MNSQEERGTGREVQAAIGFLNRLFQGFPRGDFAVRLWEGTVWRPQAGGEARFTLVLKQAWALRQIFATPGDTGPGEAYIDGNFEIEGDFDHAFELVEFLRRHSPNWAQRLRLRYLLTRLPRAQDSGARAPVLSGAAHSRGRDRQAIRYHYDAPTEFYRLWLDSNLVYSCAYFLDEHEDLETAQQRKLDYLCRKLRLKPGERLLDVGCGWGGLILHAARTYGVQALGITLSESQAEYARERIRQANLENRCRVEVCDYRDVPAQPAFDKLVSVGMFEHVGARNLPVYFRRAWELLRPGGVFLNHGISRDRRKRHRPGFVEKYVFPDGELFPVSATTQMAEDAGFELRDAENLREHYVLTLRHWSRRLAAQRERARTLVNERTYRIWRIYIAGAANEFEQGRLHLFQRLLSKPAEGKSEVPLSRADWYTPDFGPALGRTA